MGDKGSGLAGRFRRAVEARKRAHQLEDERREARLREAQEARANLLKRLSEFGQETGFLDVRSDAGGLTLRFEDRYVHFAAGGEEDRVGIEFDGMGDERHVLYRESQLGDRWVWSMTHRRREHLKPFFDEGLEALLIRALGLPDPEDEDAAPSEPSERERSL